VVFDKCRPKTFLQVLFRGTHWLRHWGRLQRRDDLGDQLILAGQHLEISALHFFTSNGWQLGLLVFLSQDFTSRFVFPKSGCKVLNLVGCVLAVRFNFVIIGLILPYGRWSWI
jgi:hypothetical protein